ncbi:hypothetical protein BGZ49_009236 [Haplosporangium sp. Z 27]|nr:hypothetical protein BGZ49_009236 [Haplosporangium sp. Z 27]
MPEHGHQLNSLSSPQADTSFLPSMLPSIFDDIQSDDNESYIIWSTPSSSTLKKPFATTTPTTTAPQPIISRPANSAPAQSSSNTYAITSTSLQSPQFSQSPSMNNELSLPSSVQEVQTPKRWSTREALKSKEKEKDKDKEGSDHDPPTRQHSQDILNSRFAGAVHSMDAAITTGQAKLSKSTIKTDIPTEGPTISNVTSSSLQSSKKAPVSLSQNADDSDRVLMAATVEKLAARLTSEIDYTFLTDFFLIYRLFITPMALLDLFILRFHWALIDDSPARKIVRIRTFVTLRHWILNYFVYDFMRSKDLRQKLNLHLRSLSKHPLVIESQRDQRIITELRRYAQSLKKIHYRNVAQKKLEKQARKLEERQNRRFLAKRGSFMAGRESSVEWSGFQVNETESQHPFSSRRSSTVAHEALRRESNVSVTLTEELTVEFRSSEQSEDEDSDMGDSIDIDDDFEPSSENSLYDSEEDSYYSTSEEHGPEESYSTDDEDLDDDDHIADSESEGLASSHGDFSQRRTLNRDAVLGKEYRFPSPAFSPRFQRSQEGGSASLRSQQHSQSIVSSATSRARVRGKRLPLPDFETADNNFIKQDPSGPSYFHGMGSNRRNRIKAQSQPLSIVIPAPLPPGQSLPQVPNSGSVRSIEPYINPPPRFFTSTEKKKTWSKYMSATVGRLSKMKNVFSNSKKGHRHSHSSSSSPSCGSISRRTASGANQSRSTSYWGGNRSDAEENNFAQYFLGSCTGMNMLIFSSEDRHISGIHKINSERYYKSEGVGSDLSSDDDYSQYEMTRRNSRQIQPQIDIALEELESMDPQLLEAKLEQAQYHSYIELTSEQIELPQPGDCRGHTFANAENDELKACSECERGNLYFESSNLRSIEHRVGETTPVPGASTSAELDQQRDLSTAIHKRNPSHQSYWMTCSSYCSSASGVAPSGNQTPSRFLRNQRSLGNLYRDTQRMNESNQDLPQTHIGEVNQRSRFALDTQNSESMVIYQSKNSAIFNPELDRQLQNRPYQERDVRDEVHLRRHSSDAQRMESWDQVERAVRETSIAKTSDVYNPGNAPFHSLQTEAKNTQKIGLTEDVTAAQFHMSPGSKQTSSVIQPSSPVHLWSQPLPMIKPVLLKRRSRSQPHLLSSFSDPESRLLSTRSPQQSNDGTAVKSESRCPHVHSSRRSRARQGDHATPLPLSRADSYFQGSNHSGHMSQRMTMDVSPHHPLESVNLVTKEHRTLPLVLRYRSELIAQQLCLIERELLDQVQWYELVEPNWNKKSASTSAEAKDGNVGLENEANNARATPETTRRVARREESQGIKNLVARFNLTCQWVSTEIVNTKDMNMRVKVIEKFIRIAHTCYNHSNFSSLIQLMLGLQAPSVSRLIKTWDRVRAQEMRIMRDLVEFTLPYRNWKHLRDAMKSIADEWGGSGNGEVPPTPPVSEKPNSGGGVAFFSRRPSRSMASAFASMGNSRRPSTSQTVDSNTVTSPSSLLSELQAIGKIPNPLSPTARSTSTKGKGKQKGGRQGGCIPFLGLYLSDLVFNSELPSYIEPVTHASSSTNTENRMLVNIHKHRTTATIIKRVLAFRTMAARYPFQPEPEVYELLMAIEGIEPLEQTRQSLLCEEKPSDTTRSYD